MSIFGNTMSTSRCSVHEGILSVHCRMSSTLEGYHDSCGGGLIRKKTKCLRDCYRNKPITCRQELIKNFGPRETQTNMSTFCYMIWIG